MKSILRMVMGTVTVMGLAAGCGGPPESAGSEQLSSPEMALQKQLRDQLWRFNSATHRQDVGALKEVLSAEVLNRLESYQGGINRFIEKERKVSLGVFKTMDANDLEDRFTVSELDVQGDVASVLPAYDGQSTGKRFYFVKEGDQYKVNVAAPGFSRPRPDRSRAAMETFVIFSDDDPPAGSQLACQTDNNIAYYNFWEGYTEIDCSDRKCGFFDGGQFYSTGAIEWSGSHFCDWHWQGWDIVVNHFPEKYIAFCRDDC